MLFSAHDDATFVFLRSIKAIIAKIIEATKKNQNVNGKNNWINKLKNIFSSKGIITNATIITVAATVNQRFALVLNCLNSMRIVNKRSVMRINAPDNH